MSDNGNHEGQDVRQDKRLPWESTAIKKNTPVQSDTLAAHAFSKLRAVRNASVYRSNSNVPSSLEKSHMPITKDTTVSVAENTIVSVTEDTIVCVTEDTVTDGCGQVLEPGDALWTYMYSSCPTAIYIGDGQVVLCKWWSNNKVVKKRLDTAMSFGKLRVVGGECRVLHPVERVKRATSRIGTKFMEKCMLYGRDFPYWVFTGMGQYESAMRGFRLRGDM